MNKKNILMLLVICLLCLVSCKNNTNSNTDNSSETQTEITTKETSSEKQGIDKTSLFKNVSFETDRMLYTNSITAADITRNPSNYINKNFALNTNINQMIEDGSYFLVKNGPDCYSVVLVSVYDKNGYFEENNILIVVKLDADSKRIIENDKVTFYCKSTDKTYTYTTVLGTQKTIPVVISNMYDVH